MNAQHIINKLQLQYPGKTIIKNDEDNPTEIICEIDPTGEHPEFDVAIAVIDHSIAHYHKLSKEEYEVIKGELVVTIDREKFALHTGEKITIYPGSIHSAVGSETWIKATSRPGWTPEDHILVKPD